MRLFLEKSGFKPEIQSDGSKVLDTAQGPDAPAIIILDWVLPGKDGLAICKELRAARLRSRPYVIMFSSRNGGNDVVTALNAGADDFISKPFNVIETQARLKVASRLVEYQSELLQQISDNDTLIQRNSLLGEIIHRKAGGHPGSHSQKAQQAPKSKAAELNSAEFSLQELRFVTTAALLELRLATESISSVPLERKETPFLWHSWSSLVLPEHGLWMDLVLQGENASVLGLFKRSVGRDPLSESERNVYFSEIARTIAVGFSRAMNVRSCKTIAPLMARTKLADGRSIPHNIDARCYSMTVDGQKLSLTLSVTPSSSIEAKASELQEFDILAEQFPAPEVSEVPMFMQGVSLNPRFIEKIRHISDASTPTPLVPVHRPTSVARYFNGYA